MIPTKVYLIRNVNSNIYSREVRGVLINQFNPIQVMIIEPNKIVIGKNDFIFHNFVIVFHKMNSFH